MHLAKHGIEFDATQSLIRCFTHIVNLCCQDVIRSITDKTLLAAAVDDIESDTELSTNMSSFPLPIPLRPATQTYEQACACDPIALGRHIVSGIHASGQRHEEFETVIIDGNLRGHWEEQVQLRQVDGKVQVTRLQLLCDVDTRWDSVYTMCRHLRILQQVSIVACGHGSKSSPGCMQPIDTFLHHPRRVNNVGHYHLTNQEWNVLKDFEFILEVWFIFCNVWGCH